MDYSFPLGTEGGAGLNEPYHPSPEANAYQSLRIAEQPFSLPELESVPSDSAGTDNPELAKLPQWFNGLPDSEKQQALASVAKTLSFAPELALEPQLPAPSAPAPGQAPLSFACYADPALKAPGAPLAAAPAAASRKSLALHDRTNLQGSRPAAAQLGKTAHMKQLSSRLHVAHSKKAPAVRLKWTSLGLCTQLPACCEQAILAWLSLQVLPPDEVKALIDFQLQSRAPTRAPWWRDNQPRHPVQSKHAEGGENAVAPKPPATSQVRRTRHGWFVHSAAQTTTSHHTRIECDARFSLVAASNERGCKRRALQRAPAHTCPAARGHAYCSDGMADGGCSDKGEGAAKMRLCVNCCYKDDRKMLHAREALHTSH